MPILTRLEVGMTQYFDENGIECDKENAYSACTENEEAIFVWVRESFLWFAWWKLYATHYQPMFGTSPELIQPKKPKPIPRPD